MVVLVSQISQVAMMMMMMSSASSVAKDRKYNLQQFTLYTFTHFFAKEV